MVHPATIVSVHGTEIDMHSMQARLPQEKIIALTCALTKFK